MQKYAALIAIIIVIAYGIYNASQHRKPTKKPVNPNYARHIEHHKAPHTPLAQNLTQATFDYVVEVIDHGSSRLHFKKEEIMEGGYIAPDDAPNVACYVLKLSGKTCPAGTESTDATMLFTSVCGGCHGNDGRGIGGTYPDLTRPVLLGLQEHFQKGH